MKNGDAKELLKKFHNGECSPQELETVTYWLHHFRSDSSSGYSDQELELISAQVWENISTQTAVNNPIRRSIWPRIAAAAAIFICIISGIYLYQQNISRKQITASIYKNDIDPGKEKAYLILADGKKINLDNFEAGKLDQPGVEISKTGDGMIVYKISPDQTATDETNTLQTPNGGRFQVMLPDGTNVWLNAASSLSYPLSFKGKVERLVTLSGEGYFEVAHDAKHPFLVRSGSQTVQVLGTHFNIQAYANEKGIKTTLLSGLVKVYGASVQGQKILKPGQQSEFTPQNINVSTGDTEQATAWVSDDFVFAGEDLQSVMRQIARWYDVEVKYEGAVSDAAFYSTISRKKKLSEILKALTLNQGVHFKLEGRRITVMP